MDFAFVAIFIALALGFRARRGFAPAVLASVAASAAAFCLFEGTIYIMAGGLAGIFAAVLFGGQAQPAALATSGEPA